MSDTLLGHRIYLLQVIAGFLLKGNLRRARKSSRTIDSFSKKPLLFFLACVRGDWLCTHSLSIFSFLRKGFGQISVSVLDLASKSCRLKIILKLTHVLNAMGFFYRSSFFFPPKHTVLCNNILFL